MAGLFDSVTGPLGSVFGNIGGGQGGMGEGLGGALSGILGGGNVKTNYNAPQIDTGATDLALQKLQYGGTPDTQAATALTKDMAMGKGPSVATATLQQAQAQQEAAAGAMAASGSGAAGQGLARRQAMMQGAAGAQQLGGAAATARAAEQTAGTQLYGNMAATSRQQDIASALGAAGIQSGLATNQAGLEQQTNQLNAQGQAQNQQAGNSLISSTGGAVAGVGALMASSPETKTNISDASGALSSPPAAKTDVKPASPAKPKMSTQDMVRSKHAKLYRPEVIQQMLSKYVAPVAGTEEATAPKARPEVRMPRTGAPYGDDSLPSPQGYRPQVTVPEQTVSADEDEKPLSVTGKYSFVPPTPQHEYSNPEAFPTVGEDKVLDYYPGDERGLRNAIGRTRAQALPEKTPLKTELPATDAIDRDAPTKLSSPPEAKQNVGSADNVDDALRQLHPYSYNYKDPRNEPIPNPTGKERFFGVMTTDLKKHPVTAAMVSGQGADEKVAIPAATSFTLASVAHHQNKVDEYEQRISALEKMLGSGGKGALQAELESNLYDTKHTPLHSLFHGYEQNSPFSAEFAQDVRRRELEDEYQKVGRR